MASARSRAVRHQAAAPAPPVKGARAGVTGLTADPGVASTTDPLLKSVTLQGNV